MKEAKKEDWLRTRRRTMWVRFSRDGTCKEHAQKRCAQGAKLAKDTCGNNVRGQCRDSWLASTARLRARTQKYSGQDNKCLPITYQRGVQSNALRVPHEGKLKRLRRCEKRPRGENG